MGRITPRTQFQMGVINIINKLSYTLYILKINNIEANFYLFGSYILNPSIANDIDILIIYKDKVAEIKKELDKIQESFLFDTIFLTKNEEAEFNFI